MAALSHDERMASLTLAEVYPHYVTKAEKKGYSERELLEVIAWLTGFEDVVAEAKLNPNASLITGVICGVRVEEIENPLTQQVRYLDKLVDELAKGKAMEKILRS